MRKGKLISKIFGIGLVFAVIGSMFGGWIGIASVAGASYTLTTSVPSGGGGISLNPAGGSYSAGTPVTVTANQASGYTFVHWGGSAVSGWSSQQCRQNPITITMDSSKSVSAYFEGITISVTSPQAGAVWNPGNSYRVEWSVSDDGYNKARISYFWVYYSTDDGGIWQNIPQSVTTYYLDWVPSVSSTNCRIKVRAIDVEGWILDEGISGRFAISAGAQVTLTTSVPSGGGGISLNPAGGSYSAGTPVTVTANQASGYTFVHWGGSAVSGWSSQQCRQNPITITMDSSKSVSAYFEGITISVTSPQAGAVWNPGNSYRVEWSVSDDGYNKARISYFWVYYSTDDGGIWQNIPQSVTTYYLDWVPSVSSTNCRIKVRAIDVEGWILDEGISGRFAISAGAKVTLTTSVPSGGGGISLNPAGGSYSAGTPVTVTANQASGYTFVHWGGSAVSGWSSQQCRQNPITITMDSSKSVSAYFEGITISVTSPQAGAVWNPGNSYRVEWSVSDDGYNKARISYFWVYYSTDDGGIWQNIPQSVTTYYLDWVPSVSSTNCRIKVRAIDVEGWILDEGISGRFAISAGAQVTLTTSVPSGGGGISLNPAGGSYSAGTPVTVTANQASGYTFVHWGGSAVSGWSSQQCRQNPITITMDSSKSVSAYFEGITISVTSPQAGAVWNPGNSYRVEWSVSDDGYNKARISYFWVYYSTDDGGIWQNIPQSVTTYYLDWVPSVSSTNCRIKVRAIDVEGWILDEGISGRFAISAGAQVTLTTSVPSGGGGISLNPAGGSYSAGTPVTVTANQASGYTFVHWGGSAVSGWSSQQCRQNPITITMDSSKSVSAYFEGITISVTSPQAGAVWNPGNSYRVEWSVSDDGYNKARISYFWVYYSTDDGGIWQNIPQSVTTYYLDWVPSVSSTNCRIKVRAIDVEGWILDEGISGRFAISAGAKVTLTTSVPSGGGGISLNPAGGSYSAGTPVTVTANQASGYTFVHWGGSAVSGWSSQQCRQNPITITMDSSKSVSAYFEGITISVTSPQAGAVWNPGNSYRVEWSVSDDGYNKARISYFWVYYSTDDGGIWQNIPQSVTTYYLDWVPSVSSTNCRIKVRAIDVEGWILDEGISGRFAISAGAKVTLTTSVPSGGGGISLNPAGGSYSAGTPVTVTANQASGYTFVHWGGSAVSGWSSQQCRQNPITITMDSSKSVSAYFEGITISVTSPQAGAVWNPGNSYRVEWSVSDDGYNKARISYFWVYYSTDDGGIWQNIPQSVTTYYLDWVFSVSSTNCRIKVRAIDVEGWILDEGISGRFAISAGALFAYIDSISPNPANQGEAVSFSGHGTGPDPGDSITAYNWRSSIDGQLSTSSSFTKSNLSVGTHTIYFKVKDSHDTWSPEVTYILTINPTLAPKLIITSPLQITPEKDKYYVSDLVTARFTIKNVGSEPIILDKLIVGGTFNNGKLPNGEYPDFSTQSLTLSPGQPHPYEGTLELTEAGDYHFLCAYQTPDGEWNTSLELDPSLADGGRVKDITVQFPTDAYISQITPNFGVPGDTVAITGVNFDELPPDPGKQWIVDFGGSGLLEKTEILSVDTESFPNKIVVKVPAWDLRLSPEKRVDVHLAYGLVILATKTSNEVQFTFMEPVLENINPPRANPGGSVTLTGDYFGDGTSGSEYFLQFGAERFYANSKGVDWSVNRIEMEVPPVSLVLGGTKEARLVDAILLVKSMAKSVGETVVKELAKAVIGEAMAPDFIASMPVSDDEWAWLVWFRAFFAELLHGFDVNLAGDLTVKVTVNTPVGESAPAQLHFHERLAAN